MNVPSLRPLCVIFTVCISISSLSTARAAACDGFTDVDSGNSTYCSAVTYLKDKGITLGCTGATYCPNDYVTRLQMALFLQRMGQADPSNTLGGHTDTVGGGTGNTASDPTFGSNTVGGGFLNSATGGYSTASGGYGNFAVGFASAVVGGAQNVASGSRSTVAGGQFNVAAGDYSIVLGGASNTAAGNYSVALGYRANTTVAATGSFVFGDSTPTDVGSGTPNEFIVAASGGIRMLSDKSGTVGCSLAGGGGTWACASSHDVKRDFKEIDRQQVLDRVLALPVQTWRYKNEAPDIRHMGTFAQDFRAAFGLGSDDKTISMADADGVALAAIQGLSARLEASQELIAEQARELAEIRAQLAAMAAAH